MSTCGTCRFKGPGYDSDRFDQFGQDRVIDVFRCHRYPPTPIMGPRQVGSSWPQIVADDWCGEYQPVEDEP